MTLIDSAPNKKTLLLWPVTAVIGPITATNLAISLALPFSGFAVYLLARRYVRSRCRA